VNFYSKRPENVIFFASPGALSLRTHGSDFEVGRGWIALDLPKNKFFFVVRKKLIINVLIIVISWWGFF
jgi:hypothetical protein